MCASVCVCVCAPTVFKLGSQIDFCVFCTSLRYFRRIPTHMQPKSVFFPLPLLVPLALLSNVYTATAIISMFFSSRLDQKNSHLVKYGFSSGASIRSRTLPWILYEQNPSTMKCSRGQLRNNGACCARANARVRFQLRTAFSVAYPSTTWAGAYTDESAEEQQKMGEVEFSLNSPMADPSGSL